MGRLREINAKAQFAFAPTSTLIVCGTAAGSLSDDLSDESRIEIYDPNLGSTDPEAFTLKPENGVTVESRCVDISWGAVTTERPQGVIAAAMDDGNVDFWDPQAILSGSGEAAALIHRGTAHTGAVKCIDFNTVQTNLLASAGTKGEFFVWDATKPTAAPTAYKSTRLDEIVSLSWNKKVGHIIALGGRGGALSIWDLRKKSELLHIPTRYHISAISWHPSEPTLLMTASGDDHNPVLQLWDLRNANTPKCTLSGHERGVLSLSWCASDPELLLSSGSDNRTLIWNPIQATIVAELPASSQWVHKVSWCRKQPAMISNATLDGKITIYSIQDTTEPEAAPIIDGTPAGDDFFDSIPKNFQAQSTTFTLKQTPKWLKRPASAAFGYGGKLVYLTPGSFKVGIVQQSLAGQAIEAAKILKEDLSTKSTAELCHAAQENANENEKQDWDVIETLTAEHARDALLKYLGFTKADVETEIMQKLVKLGITTDSVGANQSTTTKSGADQTTEDIGAKDVAKLDEDRLETSVFGDDVGDDDFLGSINIEAQAPTDNKTNGLQSTTATPKSSQGPFTIFESAIAKPDELITRAILTGQFDIAIDVCLSEERLSDAFMLALCGGPESQKKVQEAYFTRTKVPYGRLLSSIVAGDLRDIVEHADLAHWKEILTILCNYAKPEDFSQLCEALGKRLESEGGDQQHATLCYLAGSKLEHLVRIWSSAQSAEEESLLSKETTMAPFEIHFTTLCKLMRKVSVFRKAVSFTDDQKMTGSAYELAALYAKYVEFAGILTSTGDASLALDYLGLVPNAYDAVDSMRKRLTGPVAPSQAAQKTTGMRPTGMRNVYTQPQPAQQIPASHAAVTPPSYGRSVTSPAISEVPTKPISRAMPAPNLYAAATNEPGQKPSAPYNPYAPQQGNVSTPVPAYQQQAYGQTHYGQQSPQQPNLNAFAPPPRMTSAGPTILPAAQRKDITPWNDAPDVPLPAPRRPTPSTSRSAIASPFPNQPSPTLQAFGPSQTAALAPPPKSRSPAPPRAQPGPVPSANGPVQTRVPSNPYAPMPQAVNADVPAPSQAPTTPSASMYGAPPQPAAQSAAPAPSRYNPPTAAPTAQPFASAPPPPSTGKQNFAPPPKTAGGPPRLAATKPQSPIIQSPTVAGGIALSREPSRQSSPAPAKPTVPAAIHPAGDRTHIDAADMIIPDQMTALLKHLQAISPEKYRRPLEDTNRRLGLLFDQLNNAQLAPATLSQVHLLSSALHASDWARAYAIHMDLTANNMHEVRDWIVGIKTLIVIGKKSGEDGWQ